MVLQILSQVNADTSYLMYLHVSISFLEPNLALSQYMARLVHVSLWYANTFVCSKYIFSLFLGTYLAMTWNVKS